MLGGLRGPRQHAQNGCHRHVPSKHRGVRLRGFEGGARAALVPPTGAADAALALQGVRESAERGGHRSQFAGGGGSLGDGASGAGKRGKSGAAGQRRQCAAEGGFPWKRTDRGHSAGLFPSRDGGDLFQESEDTRGEGAQFFALCLRRRHWPHRSFLLLSGYQYCGVRAAPATRAPAQHSRKCFL